jgi:hypothetical protein
MQLAYFNGILVEACEYALCHQLDVVDACRQLETVQLCEFLLSGHKGYKAYIQTPDPDRVVIGGTDKEGLLLGVHAEGGDCLRVAAEGMDHLPVLVQLPHEDVTEEGRGDEILELL